MDQDGSGSIELMELYDIKRSGWSGSPADAMSYHDEDGDGAISKEELRASMLQWNVVCTHHHAIDEM